jgi:mannosylfructose-phosphate synthase
MVEVFQRVPDARLVLAIGSTALTSREEEMVGEYKHLAAELGIADHVEFRDYIPDEELADCYRAADLFALSSRYEPFGMTAVEAMACGTPTIVTTEGGLWEQVTWGREAVFANPFDPAAFGHAISFVLQYNAIYDRLAKFGCQKARAHFTWTGIAQKLINLVDAIPHGALDHAWSSPLEEESLVGD